MIIRLAALGAIGAAGYAVFRAMNEGPGEKRHAAYSKRESDGPIRNAGAEATATGGDVMDDQDQALDETFPASDPVAKY